MAQFKGIDISEFQTVYDFKALSKAVDFVILRAGFGFSTIDKEFNKNITGCINNKIPYGVYWFSYATCEADAEAEAGFLCTLLSKYSVKPSYPVFFDWEYDSDRYAKQHGVYMTKTLLTKCARAFCNVVKSKGYMAGIYTNLDYINRMYDPRIFAEYTLWYAQWAEKQEYDAPIWQYSSEGSVAGVSGSVDLDISHVDFPAISGLPSQTKDIPFYIEEVCKKYEKVCKEIMNGKWGAGDEREKKLIKAGYSYDIAQGIINEAYRMKGDL